MQYSGFCLFIVLICEVRTAVTFSVIIFQQFPTSHGDSDSGNQQVFQMGRTKRQRKHKQFSLEYNLNNDPTIILLRKWMNSNGWSDISRLILKKFDSTGRGVCAYTSIKPGEVLIEVPINLMITPNDVRQSCDMLSSNDTFQYQDLLTLYIALQKHLGSKSKWRHYITSLPPNCPSLPFLCTEEEINLLPLDIRFAILRSSRLFEESRTRVFRSIKSTWLCPCCSERASCVLNTDLFTWSYVMVNTRAVYLNPGILNNELPIGLSDEPSMAMCPFLDMFNHDFKAKTEIRLGERNEGLVYQLVTQTPTKKYEQIFISYGAHDNLKLLCEYGFFLLENRLDVVRFEFDEVRNVIGGGFRNGGYKFLTDRGLLSDLSVGYGGISFNLKAVLFVFLEEDVRKWKVDIFTGGYSEKCLGEISNLAGKLLSYKRDCLQRTLVMVDGNAFPYSKHFLVVIDYLRYCVRLIDTLANKMSDEFNK